ncbi:MAG TPA: alpha-amylase family glycosyl hydrolase [Prolixibacteraceae bacterium]|nr:alpha-amylase family glycosyl hydrolase [Prolixibacteraceae bacterium]
MKNLQHLFIVALGMLVMYSCQPEVKKSAESAVTGQAHHPEWSNDAVMYEVNVRQYTPEGTFKAFETHLPRLKELGVEILWFMPIHPISEKNRKGTLGSYYSVRDFKAVNPEFGTMADFKSLVNQAHDMGFKVIIDWVGNHTGWDNQWIADHKEWYTQDSLGNVIPPVADWSDVADLNYENQELRKAMLDALKFWVREANIDGYRCDFAGGVPTDFWETARPALDSIKPVIMLAENQDQMNLLNKAFNLNYGWKFHHLMNEVAQGKKNAMHLDSLLAVEDSIYPQNTYSLQFTSNHDENSWNGTEYERLGDAVKTMAVLSFTVPGMPLIYTGQEAGLNKRLQFFEKDSIDWTNLEMQEFYKKLIQLKKDQPALWNGEAGGELISISTDMPRMVLAFSREKDQNQVLAVFNMTGQPVEATLEAEKKGNYKEYFSGETMEIKKGTKVSLDKWGYKVFIKQ